MKYEIEKEEELSTKFPSYKDLIYSTFEEAKKNIETKFEEI